MKRILGGGLMLVGGVALILVWGLQPPNSLVIAVGALVACCGWGFVVGALEKK